MTKISRLSWLGFGLVCCAGLLGGCSPKFDWREVRDGTAHYVAAFPAKTASYSRTFSLLDTPITMTMTVAQVDGVNFAVGSAEFLDAAKAQAALAQMKIGLLKNINGKLKREQTTAGVIDIEASGTQSRYGNVQPMLLLAHFIAHDKRVYQVFVVGTEKAVVREAVDTFFFSFKPSR
jgi:hypothetical protein